MTKIEELLSYLETRLQQGDGPYSPRFSERVWREKVEMEILVIKERLSKLEASVAMEIGKV